MAILTKSVSKRDVVIRPIVAANITNPVTGITQQVFALFDTGADRDYLSRELATSLGLELKSSWMRLVTANQDVWGDQPTTNLIMESIDGSYQAIIQDALVGDFPTSGRDIPPARRDWSKYPHINKLSFIDLEPSIQVEIIISTAHMQSWMGIDSVQGESGGLVGIETRFGWTVSGTAGKERVTKPLFLFCQQGTES